MKASGTHVQSYILGSWVGEAAYELYHQHPDWFMYDRNGEVGDYDMEAHARYARRHEFEFVQPGKDAVDAQMDPTRPETRRWVADQIIRLGKEMGFQGARWDVWMMNVAPGNYRMDGSEIAPTLEQADRLSAESIKAVKDLVAQELPDFTWGYNMCGPEENKNSPRFLAERCKGGAWILDEIAITYGEKTSPFHFWNAYGKRMIEWGEHIRRLGGIYDPWTFDRGGGDPNRPEVDWLYSTIFRILAGGRVWNPLYKNNAALVGDLPRMAFRFSDTFSGWNLHLQPEDQKRVAVEGPPTLWWKGSVLSNRSPEGKDQCHCSPGECAGGGGSGRKPRFEGPSAGSEREGGLPRGGWPLAEEGMAGHGRIADARRGTQGAGGAVEPGDSGKRRRERDRAGRALSQNRGV